MILCERCDPACGTIQQVAPEQVRELLLQEDAQLWIDLQSPHVAEFDWLEELFHFHPLAMEDVRKHRQRPKMDQYGTYAFFVLRSVTYHPHTHRIDSHEIDLFLGRNYLVTVHEGALNPLTEARNRWHQVRFPHPSTSFLFYLVVDAVVDDYFPVVERLGNLIDEVDEVLLHKPSRSALATIFALRKSLLAVRKLSGPLRDALHEFFLTEEGLGIDKGETRIYLTDVIDHVLRVSDFVDTYRDMLTGSLEAYQSSLANRLNENMQRLTVAATVLATATVITGFYGMNLRGLLINSGWSYGGHFILGALVVVTAIEIWLFRRAGWL